VDRYSAFSVSFAPAQGALGVLGGLALGRRRKMR
jgi:MYXO-CTERM domain-containing protein